MQYAVFYGPFGIIVATNEPVNCAVICLLLCVITQCKCNFIMKPYYWDKDYLHTKTVGVSSNFELLHFRPDGTKKAYVRLTPDYDALDVANKIGII